MLRPEYSIYILRVYTGWKEQRIGRVKDQLRKQKTQSQRLESWIELPTTIPDDHPQVTDWSLAASYQAHGRGHNPQVKSEIIGVYVALHCPRI